MKLLLDTHALIWFLADDPRLSTSARTTIEHANPRLLSPVSLQEIAIKVQLDKLSGSMNRSRSCSPRNSPLTASSFFPFR